MSVSCGRGRRQTSYVDSPGLSASLAALAALQHRGPCVPKPTHPSLPTFPRFSRERAEAAERLKKTPSCGARGEEAKLLRAASKGPCTFEFFSNMNLSPRRPLEKACFGYLCEHSWSRRFVVKFRKPPDEEVRRIFTRLISKKTKKGKNKNKSPATKIKVTRTGEWPPRGVPRQGVNRAGAP